MRAANRLAEDGSSESLENGASFDELNSLFEREQNP